MAKYHHSAAKASPAPSPVVPVRALSVVQDHAAPAPAADPEPLPAPAPLPQEQFFKVGATCHVPMLGAHFVLPVGKIISSAGYDIQALLTLGVPLEKVTSGENARRALVLR